MFTGIIESTGRVNRLERNGSDARLTIDAGKLDLSDTKIGDSIAVNGVCLTAIELDNSQFSADVSAETLSRTSLAGLATGSAVNLELAMRPDTRFGGHIVSGHVDGLGHVTDINAIGESTRLSVSLPDDLACYIAEKGSVTIDGVSLTVNRVSGNTFDVNIVPHTQQETIISNYNKGSRVNIEVDIIARYLERLLQCGKIDTVDGMTSGEDSLMNKIHDMYAD